MADLAPDPQPDSVVGEYELSHSTATVWRALTTPELLARWLAANDIEPRLGHRFRIEPEDGPAAECEVVEIEPERRLAFTWRIDGHAPSVVRFELSPTADGARLRVSHTGLPLARAEVVAFPARRRPALDTRTRLQWAA